MGSKIFLISDTHFLHHNIIKYCDRPENHEDLIIENWNRVVSDDDVVFHLGDIAAGVRGRKDLLVGIFSKLKGKKYLVRGNHDHYSDKWYKEKLGFEDVSEYLIMGDILLWHYPLRTNEWSKPEEIESVKRMKKIKEEKGLNKIIHGHIHNRETGLDDHYNVSVEAINYTPIEINELLS